jgi:hypothetical protein
VCFFYRWTEHAADTGYPGRRRLAMRESLRSRNDEKWNAVLFFKTVANCDLKTDGGHYDVWHRMFWCTELCTIVLSGTTSLRPSAGASETLVPDYTASQPRRLHSLKVTAVTTSDLTWNILCPCLVYKNVSHSTTGGEEALTVVHIHITVFWNMTPCSRFRQLPKTLRILDNRCSTFSRNVRTHLEEQR